MTKEAREKAPAKAKKDVEMLSLCDVARDMGVDLKTARDDHFPGSRFVVLPGST